MCPLQLGPSCARHVQSPRPCLPPPLLPLPRCIMPPDPGMWILSTVFAAAPAARSTSPTLPLAFAGATVSAGVAGGILFTTRAAARQRVPGPGRCQRAAGVHWIHALDGEPPGAPRQGELPQRRGLLGCCVVVCCAQGLLANCSCS